MHLTGAVPAVDGTFVLRAASRTCSLIAALLMLTVARHACANGTEFPWSPCRQCNFLVGVGATFHPFDATGGLVIPLTFTFAEGRWELGAFRFATSQRFAEANLPFATLDAHPYWGFSGARRWNVWNPDWGKLFLGFGAGYRSKTDYIEATRWTFAYQLSVRVNLGRHGELLEFSIRHWSNAWVKLPNRGQNFATLSFAF